MSTFLNRLREHFTDVLYIFRQELLHVVKDEGVLLFLVLASLAWWKRRVSRSVTFVPRHSRRHGPPRKRS